MPRGRRAGGRRTTAQVDQVAQDVQGLFALGVNRRIFAVVIAAIRIRVVVSGPAAAAAPEKPAEKTEFTVSLDGLADPTKKINVIKVVREITNLGLKEAKDLVEGAPKPVKEGVNKDDAAKIKATLEKVGAKVELK